jgi:hypothetical protein
MHAQVSIHVNVSADVAADLTKPTPGAHRAVSALREVLSLLQEQGEKPLELLGRVESSMPAGGKADASASTAESFEDHGVAVSLQDSLPGDTIHLGESHPSRFRE